MIILGINAGVTVNQHDPAAALVRDGELVCCVEEERLYRIKSPRGFLPIESIAACLKEAKITMKDVDLVVLPGETYADLVERTASYFRHHFGHAPKTRAINHQLAHLASAFFQSGFDQATCISYDAYGDRLSAALAIADRKKGITIQETRPFDNSLGHFYGTVTSFLGFYPGEDDYKVMGLAPYAKAPADLSFFGQVAADGYHIDGQYIRRTPSPTFQEPFYTDKLVEKLGPPRRKDEPITDRHRAIAGGAQVALEAMAISLVTYYQSKTKLPNLCLAGGVALNCSLNRYLRKLPFVGDFFVQPAASDRGLALGCALQAAFEEGDGPKPVNHVFYGPSASAKKIEDAIALTGIPAVAVDDPSAAAAERIAQGKIIGWYQGRSEFGPRALGHRSILANPAVADMKDQITAKVKVREEFRPFAPSVLEEKAKTLYDMREASPYMTVAYDVHAPWNAKMPSTTHVNNTARVQTVARATDPLFYELIRGVEKETGCPAVLNTSFNIKGQPIVETPLDAISTFYGTGMDHLIMGNYLVSKPGAPRK